MTSEGSASAKAEPRGLISSAFRRRAKHPMDRTFRYLWHRGLLLVLVVHPIYKALLLLHDYEVNGQAQIETSFLPGPRLFMPLRLRLTFDNGELIFSLAPWPWLEALWANITSRANVPDLHSPILKYILSFYSGLPVARRDLSSAQKAQVLALILLASLASSVLAAIFYLPMYIIWALIRGFSTTLKAALRPVPALLAVLVVVFTTSDAWRLFGLESYWRFTIMVAIVLGLSLSALAVGLRDSDGGWREVLGYSDSDPQLLESWAKQTPAEDLSASVQPVLPLGDGVQGRAGQNFELRPLVANVTVLYVFTMVLHIFAVAFWISLMFVIIGVVAVSGPMTKELTQAPVTVIAHFNLLGQSFMLTRQLVLLSAVLGGVAALTFATGTLQDSDSRATFARHALADLRHSLGALGYYSGEMLKLLLELHDKGVLDQLKALDSQSISGLITYATATSSSPSSEASSR